MTAHRDKRMLAAEITLLREAGLTVPEISKRIGLGKSQVGRIISLFNIPKTKGGDPRNLCPHCGLDKSALIG